MVNVWTSLLMAAVMMCSWYGPGFHGNPTASGEIYDQEALTAAHTDLEFGTRLVLVHGQNRVTVRINDRGPYCFTALEQGRLEPHPTRDLDLSRAAFRQLAPLDAGIIEVEVIRAIQPGTPPPTYIPPPMGR